MLRTKKANAKDEARNISQIGRIAEAGYRAPTASRIHLMRRATTSSRERWRDVTMLEYDPEKRARSTGLCWVTLRPFARRQLSRKASCGFVPAGSAEAHPSPWGSRLPWLKVSSSYPLQ